MKHILIIDDDIHISNALYEILTQNGYKVSRAYSGTEAVMLLKNITPDLVLLDLILPGLSGEDVLPHITDIPVIVMSAKVDVDSKVSLLLGGAIDYVTKPFHTEELLARIAVHLRNSADNTSILKFDNITLNTTSREVKINDKQVRLTKTEYAVLKILMQNQMRIVSKAKILNEIVDDTPDCTESSLKTHISHLRGKLSAIGDKDYIETIWGIGFRLK